MMRLFRGLDSPEIRTPTVLTFGVFDGLHLAHQEIMARVTRRAKALGQAATVVTFDPHPRAVLRPETAPPLLQTFEQKMEGMERLGVDQVVVLNFTAELARVSAEDFLNEIIFGRLDAVEVYLGHGFAFGHNRAGRFELLKQVAGEHGCIAQEVPEVLIRGHRVSSTMVRRLLSAGRINLARRMLGRAYGIEGRVVEGRRIGRKELSYATANLKPHNTVLPANGVYVTLTLFEGEWRRSVSNVGIRPTFGGDSDAEIETHVVDFNRQIYGEKIRVRFLYRLRDEIKFESVEALKAQIDHDYHRTLRYFNASWVRHAFKFV
jgi:riboflavin kinase/FMN adenylyltransferase